MRGVSSGIRNGAAVAALVLVPVALHIAMTTQRGLQMAGVLVAAEAALLAWIALSFLPIRLLRWIGGAAALAVTAAIWRLAPNGGVAASAVPHAIAYLSLLTVFGASLAPGRTPVITVFAEKSRGPLPPHLLRYTRRVTWAWCLFCAGQLLTSLLLLCFASAQLWSEFVNLCNVPSLVAMFGIEFAWRKWRYGSAHERLTDGFRMAREVQLSTTRDPVR